LIKNSEPFFEKMSENRGPQGGGFL